MLLEEEAKYRKEARSRFMDAVWQGKPTEMLISLAAEASLTLAVADELLEKVDQARKQIEQVNRLPRLRKDATAAQDRMEKASSILTAETAKLEANVEDASFAASNARQALYAAQDSARQLLMLHDEGLLPESRLPKEVTRLIERRQAEDVANKAGGVRIAASREVERYKVPVWQIENRLAKLPLSSSSQFEESRLQRALKVAKEELHRAEDRLKSAETAAAAAVKAIPQAR